MIASSETTLRKRVADIADGEWSEVSFTKECRFLIRNIEKPKA